LDSKDFYTKRYLWVGDLETEIKQKLFYFCGRKSPFNFSNLC
jgi:hypothetical protein